MSRIRTLLTRHGWSVALAVLLIAGVSFTSLRYVSQQAELESQREEISALAHTQSQQHGEVAKKQQKNTMSALGVTPSRIERDTALVNALLETAFSWDSGEDYDTARDSVSKHFSVPEDAAFFTEFMPPADFNKDSQGVRYYYIDAIGLNSSLGADIDVEVVDAKATDYRYAVMADVDMSADASKSTDSEGNVVAPASTTRRVLLYVTVDGQGKVSDLSGIPASGVTKTSG